MGSLLVAFESVVGLAYEKAVVITDAMIVLVRRLFLLFMVTRLSITVARELCWRDLA